MHDYLRAIGFSKIKSKKDYQAILQSVLDEPTKEFITDNGIELATGEKSREFASRLGITARGEYDEQGDFQLEYSFPYLTCEQVTAKEYVVVEKHADKEDYVGVCDEVNIGVSLIFHLLNMVDYIDNRQQKKKFNDKLSVKLSAMSLSGKVILPVYKPDDETKRKKIENAARNHMISAARDGDQDAIESLTLEDIDLYTEVSRRSKTEDVLTIVESYFMPYGITCDEYSILGDILDVEVVTNSVTGENVHILTVECNDLIFDVCINEKDLLGMPEKGRRFRGNIWLQGTVDFQ